MTRRSSQPIYLIHLQARPGTDSIRALRALLKAAGRRFGLRCIEASEICDFTNYPRSPRRRVSRVILFTAGGMDKPDE
jgi:hypothetical protein